MVQGWIPRSITITAMSLRWAVTVQAVICTSKLAALLLERFDVALPDAAPISMLTFQNTGPLSLASILRMSMHKSRLILGPILFVLTTTTLLLQFISTALLSDVKNGIVQITQLGKNISYWTEPSSHDGIFPGIEALGTRYLHTGPFVYPAFAEYSEISDAEETDWVVDTELSMRAFIPLEPEATRDLVLNYSGMATVVDTRVVCMRPVVSGISINVGFNPSFIEGRFRTDMTALRFNGSQQMSTTDVLWGGLAADLNSSTFRCGFETAENSFNKWPISVCTPSQPISGLVSYMVSDNDAKALSSVQIIINATSTFGAAGGNITIQEDGEWVLINTSPAFSISLTACYSSLLSQNRPINASRSIRQYVEPTLRWNPSAMTYDTMAVRHHLGATRDNSNNDNRTVFALEARSSWEDYSTLCLDDVASMAFDDYSSTNTTIFMCIYCWALGIAPPVGSSPIVDFTSANRQQAAIINDILQDTGNPALALQAHFTILYGMANYSYLGLFDLSGTANLVSNAEALLQAAKTYFTVVFAVTLLHLTVVSLIALLLSLCGRNVLLGNAWTIVAQLWSPETEVWLSKADGVKDSRVRKWMAAAGKENMQVCIKEVGDQLQIARRRVWYCQQYLRRINIANIGRIS